MRCGAHYSRAVVDQDVEAAHLPDGFLHGRLHLVNLVQVGNDAVPLWRVECRLWNVT
jgi:hypothetical protein